MTIAILPPLMCPKCGSFDISPDANAYVDVTAAPNAALDNPSTPADAETFNDDASNDQPTRLQPWSCAACDGSFLLL